MVHFALENGFKAQQKKRGQCVFTKLTKVTKYNHVLPKPWQSESSRLHE